MTMDAYDHTYTGETKPYGLNHGVECRIVSDQGNGHLVIETEGYRIWAVLAEDVEPA